MREYFEFYNGAKINCGESALMTLGTELARLGSSAPFVLSSATATKLGATDKVRAALSAGDVARVTYYENLPQTANTAIAREIKNTYISENCDSIVVVGGDAAIDIAKCARFLLAQSTEDIMPLAADTPPIVNVPLIAIPTENGSGKEASGYLSLEGNYLSSASLIPNVVIIDEIIAATAPTRTTAACGAYALANAIESYLSTDQNISEVFAEKAIRLLAKNLEKTVKDSEEKSACRATALAATLAGIAYGNTQCGAAHALAEGLAIVTEEPIEEMFCITLIPSIKAARRSYDDKVKQLLYLFCGANAYAETPDSERSTRAIEEISAFLDRLHISANIPTKISQTKIAREDFGKIAKEAANQRSAITAFDPITAERFLELLNEAY